MKSNKYRTIFVLQFALMSILNGYSIQNPDSLLPYIEIALRNNPSVRQKFMEYQASLQRIPQVGSLPDPELSLGVFLTPMEIVSGKQVAEMRLMQMFPWFGVLKNAKDEMSLMANAKYEIFQDSRLQLIYDVRRTWYELFKIKWEIRITEKNIDILKVIEQLVLTRFKAPFTGTTSVVSSGTAISNSGEQNLTKNSQVVMQNMSNSQAGGSGTGSKTPNSAMSPGTMTGTSNSTGLADLYRIQIESGDLENNLSSLKNNERTIVTLFNSYLYRDPASPVLVGETLSADSLKLPLIQVSDSISIRNPMLTMLELEKQSYLARKKMVTRMGYPMVGLGLDYSLINKSEMSTSEMNGQDMLMPMVTVTLPIYRRKYNAMKTEADLLSKSASSNYQAVATSLQTEYYQAVQLYQDARRRVRLYENQSQLASKTLDLTMKSYSASYAELTDVLRIRQQALDYELKKVEAIADFNTAVAWLERLGNFK